MSTDLIARLHKQARHEPILASDPPQPSAMAILLREAADALAAAAERERVLMEALEPFVDPRIDEGFRDQQTLFDDIPDGVSIGSVRRARAALAAVQASRGEGT